VRAAEIGVLLGQTKQCGNRQNFQQGDTVQPVEHRSPDWEMKLPPAQQMNVQIESIVEKNLNRDELQPVEDYLLRQTRMVY